MAKLNVNTVKLRVSDLTRKQQTTGYDTAARFNRGALQAQMEEIVFQRTLAQQGYFTLDYTQYLKSSTNGPTGTTGLFTHPTDLLYFDSLLSRNYQSGEFDEAVFVNAPIKLVTQAEADELLSDQIDGPTKDHPIAVEYSGYYTIYPFNLLSVTLYYLKVPAAPIWGFTSASGREVYDSATSTQFDLPEELLPNIVWRMCNYIGIETRQPDLLQAGIAYLQQKGVGL